MRNAPARRRPPARPSLSIDRVAIFALSGAAATVALGAYARHVAPDLTEVPILGANARLLYVLILLALTALADQVHRLWDPRQTEYTPHPPLPTAWILPTMTLLAGLLLVVRYRDWPIIAMAAIIVASGIYAVLTIRLSLTGQGVIDRATAQYIHVGLTLVVGLIALSLTYGYRLRTLYLAPLIFIIAWLLLLQIHDGIPVNPARRVMYALVGAIVVAELVWPLNYWPPAGWLGGAVLALALLGYTLVCRAQLRQQLTQARVLQYSALIGGLFAVLLIIT